MRDFLGPWERLLRGGQVRPGPAEFASRRIAACLLIPLRLVGCVMRALRV